MSKYSVGRLCFPCYYYYKRWNNETEMNERTELKGADSVFAVNIYKLTFLVTCMKIHDL